MKKLLTIISVCLMATAILAQEKADIEVSYCYEFPNFKNGNRDCKNDYILLAGTSESKFYSPRTEYIDSLQSTPEGIATLNEMTATAVKSGNFDDIPRADGAYYVLKSFPSERITYYETVGMEKLMTEEGIPQFNWEIFDSTKTVLGYECILATADFHGRKWNAWFSPEIPIMNGPWKLSGLPGLILEAETMDGLYTFIATGLQQVSKSIGNIYLTDRYEKVSPKDLLKAKRAFIDNPLGNINSQLAASGKDLQVLGGNGEQLNVNQRLFAPREEVDFIETDY